MTLPVPVLDDRNFDDLFEEARGLIPGLAPEWTDHNTHDPGITLLELVAWLVDQDLYQLGFISDEHLQAFTALVGARPHLAQPAQGLVWADDEALSRDLQLVGVNLKRGAGLMCIERPDLAFQLAADVHITLARIIAVIGAAADNLSGPRPLTSATLPALAASGDSPEEGAVDIVFDRPLAEYRTRACTLKEQSAGDEDYILALGAQIDDPLNIPADETPPGTTVVEYRLEKPGAPWCHIEVVADGTDGLSRNGALLLRIPPQPLPEGSSSQYGSRLRLTTCGRVHSFVPPITRLAVNAVPVRQQQDLPERSLTSSASGLPDQRYEDIPLQGLIDQTLVVDVEENNVLVPWRRVEDFSDQGPADRVFMVDSERGHILFGNGLNGAIPPAGAGIRLRPYTLTEGQQGNLARGCRWKLPGAPLAADTLFGGNLDPLAGGENASSVNDLLADGRARALTRDAALTNPQLTQAALSLSWLGIERVQVLSNYSPQVSPHLPDIALSDTRTLVVVPARPAAGDPFAPASARLLDTLHQRLDPRRVLGERLFVIGASAVAVSVQAELLIADEEDTASVLAAAQQVLNARLSDIRVAESAQEPWPLGRPVTPEEIKTLLARVAGVVAVPMCRLAKAGEPFQAQRIELAADQLAVGTGHALTAANGASPLAPGLRRRSGASASIATKAAKEGRPA